MSGEVRRVIAVQKVEGDATDSHLPGAQPNRVAGQRDIQPQPLAVWAAHRRDRQLSGIVVRIERLLRSSVIDHLTKIALLIEQAHCHHRHAQVACAFELIARHITEPAGINGQRFA
jgi:hypothetical protein